MATVDFQEKLGNIDQDFAVDNSDKVHARYRDMILMTDPQLDREQLRGTKGDRANGTCEWIKSNELFRSWSDNGRPLLWIAGGPGRGKTMLSIYLSEELERIRTEDEEVIFFFSMHENDRRNTAVAVLRGLIYQILWKRPQLTDLIANDMSDKNRSEIVLSSPAALWSLLHKIITDPRTPVLYCVLDGLDECDEESIRFLQRKFLSLGMNESSGSQNDKLRLIFISRVLDGFPGVAQILLDDFDLEVSHDLEILVSSRLNDFRIEDFNEEARKNIQKELIERAEGKFLWIGFVLDEMSRKLSMDALLKTMNSVPRGLPAIYDRMLQQISENDRAICAKILQWVALAMRPLDVKELAYAIGVSDAQHTSARDLVVSEIAKFGPLIQIQEEKITFVHQSARDYFLRPEVVADESLKLFQFKPSVGHRNLATTCLARLKDSPLNDSKYFKPGITRLENHIALIEHLEGYFPLLEYAIIHWHEHVRSATYRFDEVVRSLPDFFALESTLRKNCQQADLVSRYCFGEEKHQDFRMAMAVKYDIVWWAKALIADRTPQLWTRLMLNGLRDYGDRLHEYGYYPRSIFHVTFTTMRRVIKPPPRFGKETEMAVRAGRREIVQLLLDGGISVNYEGAQGKSLLMQAIDWCNPDSSSKLCMVRFLMERGAVLSGKRVAADKIRQLDCVAQNGPESYLKVCVEHYLESTTERQDFESYKWLVRCVEADNLELVRKLLDAGVPITKADIKSAEFRSTSSYGTALYDAKSEEMVATLLAATTVKPKTESEYKSTLQAPMEKAVEKRDLKILRMFLNHCEGLNPGCYGHLLDESLRVIIIGFSAKIANLLLDHGAYSDRALHIAAEGGNLKGLKLLLSRGYNVEHRSKGLTVLEYTISQSYLDRNTVDAVSFLLDRGAAESDKTLYYAVEQDSLLIVKLLLSRGFNANKPTRLWGAKDKLVDFQSPLELACWKDDTRFLEYEKKGWYEFHLQDIVSELLKYGAQSDKALYLTIEKGKLGLLKLLLAHGFRTDTKIKYTKRDREMTPLEYARSIKNRKAVVILLSHDE